MKKQEYVKKLGQISVLVVCIGTSCIFASSNELSRLPTGENVSIRNGLIEIDTIFLKNLSRNPISKEWQKNYWELIYLINLGHNGAINSGLDVFASILDQKKINRHLEVSNLARALSGRDEFWDILDKKHRKTRVKVIEYFDKHKNEYSGQEGYSYGRKNALRYTAE